MDLVFPSVSVAALLGLSLETPCSLMALALTAWVLLCRISIAYMGDMERIRRSIGTLPHRSDSDPFLKAIVLDRLFRQCPRRIFILLGSALSFCARRFMGAPGSIDVLFMSKSCGRCRAMLDGSLILSSWYSEGI